MVGIEDMRPGQPKYTRKPVDVPLSGVTGSHKPFALPPLAGPSNVRPDTTSDTGHNQNSSSTALVPAPPASHVVSPPSAAQISSGGYATALVPRLELANVGAATIDAADDDAHAGALQVKAHTARKPTDSNLGRLSTRIQNMGATRAYAAGPISQFPVHGGGHVARSAAASCARPPLAIELESFVKRELNLLARQCPTADALAKVAIGREAFGCFITHFPEYGACLEQMKGLYDAAIDSAYQLRHQRHALETENIGFRDYHRTVLERERADAKDVATKANATIAKLQDLLDRQGTRQKELELELNRMTNTLTERNQQLDDADARATLFEKAVMELTEKGVAMQQRLLATRRENERLQITINSLDRQVMDAKAAAVEELLGPASLSQRQRARSKSIAGGTLVSSVGAGSAFMTVLRDAVTHGGKEDDVAKTKRGPTSPSSAPLVSFSDPLPHHDTIEDLDMPLPGEDTREAVLELEMRLKRCVRQNLQLTLERDRFLERLQNQERERNEMTPRPSWTSVHEVLPAFSQNALATSEETLADLVDFFKFELSNEKRENERKALSATVREWLGHEDLCESDLVGRHRYFVCKGTGEHIPVYLRAAGVVRNRKMRKGQLEKLLKKFWDERRMDLHAETNLNPTPLPEYYHRWLQKVTGNAKAAIEVAYNMFSVCEQYQLDPDCAMFLRIMRGELSEHAMFDQAVMLDNLREVMIANDPSRKHALSRYTIHRILAKFFPTKAQQDMLRLRFALALTSKGQTMVDYEGLFSEDEDGNQSRFVEMIRRQHVEEATVFTVEVEEALRETIEPKSGLDPTGVLDMYNARMAIKHLDPAMPNNRVDDIMAYGCGMTVSELFAHGQHHRTEAEPFLARLRRGVLLRRYSRRPPAEGEEPESEDDSSDEENDDRHVAEDDDGHGLHAAEGEVEEIIIPEARLRQTVMFSNINASLDHNTATSGAAPLSPGTGARRATMKAGKGKDDDLKFLESFTRKYQPKTQEEEAVESEAHDSRRASAAAPSDHPQGRRGSRRRSTHGGTEADRVALQSMSRGLSAAKR
jgi:Skp family chaperone for outer membrane proteins